MKHSVPQRRDPFLMLEEALAAGWQPIDTMPVKGEGDFVVLTLSGLIRLARYRRAVRRIKPSDAYGPRRASVASVVSGNYLAAIAWKWPDRD